MARALKGYTREGAFYIHNGTELADLGGKAARLIETQDLVRQHGFEMPTAVALPWQTFAGTVERSQNVPGSLSLNFEGILDLRGEPVMWMDFDVQGKRAIADSLRVLELPFFSSSAPGEDSLASRMAGVYASERVEPRDYTPHEKLRVALSKAGAVIRSYFNALPTMLRNKHGMPHLGMSILARETVGGANGPDGSIVIQMLTPQLAAIGIGTGFGEKLVTEHKGAFYQYDFSAGKLLRRYGGSSVKFDAMLDWHFEESQEYTATWLPGGFASLVPLIHQIKELDDALRHPTGFGGDYELAFAGGKAYLLQNPSVRHLQDVSVPEEGNLLPLHGEVAGGGISRFNKIVYVPRIYGWYINPETSRHIIEFNARNAGYLIVTDGLPKDVTGICNSVGIIDNNLALSGDAHETDAVAHYMTLLRSEQIGIVHVNPTRELRELKEHGTKVGNITVVDVSGEFRYNQFTQQAGIYLDK